jgi:hypothetical protein
MNKIFPLVIISLFTTLVKAQTATTSVRQVQPFGKIDTADLKMKSCDFEKDANAMVLFDYGDIYIDQSATTIFVRHKRIKIFNDNGKDEANINIEYVDGIQDIEAETINLNGKTIEYTPVDSKLIYKEKINKYRRSLVFTFPGVKPGSVIEFQYKWKIYSFFLPTWNFQWNIPTAYSEIGITIAHGDFVRTNYKVSQEYSKKINEDVRSGYSGRREIRALSNIHSFKDEPYMTPVEDNLQRVEFKPLLLFWERACKDLLIDDDFGKQLDRKLPGEDELTTKIIALKNKDLIIDSIFNTVKNRMVWNKKDRWFTVDGTQKAWDKKTGNSTEINLMLYHLLTKAGIDSYPMLVSTPEHGKVDPADAELSQFNKTVVYVAVDSTKYYILDATGKYNLYNQVPLDLLSTIGLAVAPQTRKYYLLNIQSDTTAKQLVYIRATINANGKMNGTADIISDSYNREGSLRSYDDLGEKKYIDLLTGNNNDVKISALKLDNVKSDTLPLEQHIEFDMNLSASDDNYIYFNPNLFTTIGINPFLSENRYSDIDFHYSNKYIISGTYKIPDGYKVDVLPRDQIMTTEDKGLSFKRIVGEENGVVTVRYVITRKKTYYYKEDYSGLFKFYKKMYEMLNEQIVLKKS